MLKPLSEATSSTPDDPIIDGDIPNFLMLNKKKGKSYVDLQIESLPPLTSDSDPSLFIKKTVQCSKMCNFYLTDADPTAKSIKLASLKEIAAIDISTLNEDCLKALFQMIKTNIFRELYTIDEMFTFIFDDPSLPDFAWPHLSIVYSIFEKNSKLFWKYFDDEFLDKFIHNLNSTDPNEGMIIERILEEYSAANPNKVEMIVREMAFLLHIYIDDKKYPFCVGPITTYYKVVFPAHPEMAEYIMTIVDSHILPLISTPHISSFYPQFTALLEYFMTTNPSSAKRFSFEVIKRWPETRPPKQILLMKLLNFIVEHLTADDFEEICEKLFKFYGRAALTPHHKVTDAAFSVWYNVKIIPLILDNSRIIYPIVHPIYTRIMKTHWSTSSQNAALNALKSMHDIEPFTFDELSQINKRSRNFPPLLSSDGEHKKWAIIARAAAKTDSSFNLARILADIQIKFNQSPSADNTESADIKKSSTKSFRRLPPF